MKKMTPIIFHCFPWLGKILIKTPLLLASLPIKIEDVNKYIMTSQQAS